MTTRSCQIPAVDVVTAPSAGDTALLGGVVARWTEEAATLTETEPSLKQIDLVNYELSGYSKVSNTLLADSGVGLETFLMQIFSRAIAWYEDYGFLRGNGVAKPLGVASWAGVLQPTRTTANGSTCPGISVGGRGPRGRGGEGEEIVRSVGRRG